jgi:hypothetical protein
MKSPDTAVDRGIFTLPTMLIRILLIMTIFTFVGPADEQSAAAAQPSGLRLVGTVEGAPFAGAVFDDGSGIQTFYRLRELLPDGSKIVKIGKDSIEVKKPDGAVYELFTTGDANALSVSSAVSPASPTVQSPTSGATPRPRGRLGRQRETGEE